MDYWAGKLRPRVLRVYLAYRTAEPHELLYLLPTHAHKNYCAHWGHARQCVFLSIILQRIWRLWRISVAYSGDYSHRSWGIISATAPCYSRITCGAAPTAPLNHTPVVSPDASFSRAYQYLRRNQHIGGVSARRLALFTLHKSR